MIGRLDAHASARELVGRSGTWGLSFVGPPGIGKSTLLEATASAALEVGFDVRRSRAAAPEAALPFVGLHDLLGDAGEQAVRLPPPLRRALDIVLLRVDPPQEGTDALAVNLAVTEILTGMTRRRRLLLVLDDLQWLDQPTRSVLAFAMRRLPEIGVAAAVRETSTDLEEVLPRPVTLIHVKPMSEDEIADVVALRTGTMPAPRLVPALHRMSGGNPLLAVELARTVGEGSADPDLLPVPSGIRPLMRTRLAGLSAPARRVLLAAALTSRPVREDLERIGAPDAVVEAEAAGVLRDRDGRMELEHPLLAAECRDEAGAASVAEMHRVLAPLATDHFDRARHLALGTLGTDAALASTLEEVAHDAARRAAPSTAAELGRQSLRLTPHDAIEDRVRRAVTGAEWLTTAGDRAAARREIRPLLCVLPPGSLRARCLVALADSMGQEIEGSLGPLREALAQPGLDPGVLASIHLAIAQRLLPRGSLEDGRGEAMTAAEVADEAGLEDVAKISRLLAAQIDLFLGVPLASSEAWATVYHPWPAHLVGYDHPHCALAWDASWRDDQATAARLLDALIEACRDRGDLASVGPLLLHRCEVALRAGDLAFAASHADRSYRLIADGERDQFALYVRAHAAAWQGHLNAARQDAATALRMAADTGDVLFECQSLLVLGFTELSAGRPQEAASHAIRLHHLQSRMRWGHPGAYRWQGDAVEALIAVGRPQAAADITGQLWDQAAGLDLPGCRSLAARCDGLLLSQAGEHKTAEDSLRHSVDLTDDLDMPLERGRSLLALGITRRRNRQKTSARSALAEARELFSQAGAVAWVQRVDGELERATGARAGRELTPTERRIAGLVASGKTNAEVGAALFLSPKTVETTLTRIYRKVGVRSRTELARLLPPEDEGIP